MRRYRKITLLAVLVLGFPALVRAQGVGITAINFRQYLAGAAAPVSGPFTIAIANVVCNQVNPVTSIHTISWDDPADTAVPPTHSCVYVDPGTGPLFASVSG